MNSLLAVGSGKDWTKRREGIYLLKLIAKAEYDCKQVFCSDISDKRILWREINRVNPRVILTLGIAPTSLLLRSKNYTIKLADVIGEPFSVTYMSSIIVPWYSADFVMNRGGLAKQTFEFLINLKEQYELA